MSINNITAYDIIFLQFSSTRKVNVILGNIIFYYNKIEVKSRF